MMRFVLIDLSQGAQCADGTSLSPAILAAFAEAYTKQLNTHYSAEYGGNFEVRAGANQADLQDGENPFAWLATAEQAPGAIAWHQTNGNGQPLLFDAVTASDTVNGPGNSCAVAGSHELLETARDAGCNLYAEDGQGRSVALEVADPVENQTYPMGATWLSNFALNAWFTPGSLAPYSFMARTIGANDAPSPLTLGLGLGYMIQQVYDPSSEQAVQGFRIERVGSIDVARRKSIIPGSRKHRRLVASGYTTLS